MSLMDMPLTTAILEVVPFCPATRIHSYYLRRVELTVAMIFSSLGKGILANL